MNQRRDQPCNGNRASTVKGPCQWCLTIMRPILLALLAFGSLATGTWGLRLERLDVPGIADPRWPRVALRCEYDLEGLDLYSVKWYKNGDEFFRYMPGSRPRGREFTVEGVYVDLNRSDSNQVTLLGQLNEQRGKVNLAGSYGCEVSTEGPNFLTAYGEANMTVAIPAMEPPVLHGFRPSYEAGAILEVECTSAASYPPAVLVFVLNGQEVNRAMTSDTTGIGSAEESLMTESHLGFSLRLERHHFPGGMLTLVCQSTLPGIPGSRPLKTRKTATLAASNQRLAQEPPRSNGVVARPILPTGLLVCSLLIVLEWSSVEQDQSRL